MAGTLFFQRQKQNVEDISQIESEVADKEKAGQRIFMLSPGEITPNPSQPRRFFTEEAILRLADSIRIHGIIQPLCVRIPENENGYELVAGERRLRAARLLGMDEVPCLLTNADSKESAHLAIIENIQRENLNMFEQAVAILSLMKVHCLTQEKIADQLSCSQSYVANKLRLLKINEDERDDILRAGLTERHARALLRVKDENKRKSALHTIIRRNLNVAATEEYIDRLLIEEKEKAKGEHGGKTKLIIKDVRLFYNTIDKAVETIRLSGIPVETRRRENVTDTEIVIVIPRSGNSTNSAPA